MALSSIRIVTWPPRFGAPSYASSFLPLIGPDFERGIEAMKIAAETAPRAPTVSASP
jgi:hypothetical protein